MGIEESDTKYTVVLSYFIIFFMINFDIILKITQLHY